MHLGKDGYLWVGTWGAGLNRFDTRTGRVDRLFRTAGDPESLPGEIVTAIVGDGDGGIYVGLADAGLAHLESGQTRFTRLPLFDWKSEDSRPANIASLFRDSKGSLWVGTWNQGLCLRPAGGNLFRCFTHDPNDYSSINDNNVRAINEDDTGSIWIATGNGICRFDALAEVCDRYTSADGLVPGVIYGILPESQHVLWLSSNRGLIRLDTQVRESRQYEYKDGLQANEFNGGAYLRSSTGQFFFGGVGGITVFEPNNLSNNRTPPQVIITDFSLFNQSVDFHSDDDSAILRRPVPETKSLDLSYDQNFIGFEFAGLHYVSPERNQYAYQLEGFDDGRIETSASRRFATYTNLDPGSYRFRVRAANSDGRWSDTGASIDILINPPWWLTWWARTVFAIAAALTLVMFIQWRLSLLRIRTRELESEVDKRTEQIVAQKDTIEQQASHLEEALESKNQFFARLSHEFRTPITLILGPIEEGLKSGVPKATEKALAIATRNGKRLLHLVDQLLALAKYEGGGTYELVPTPFSQIAQGVVAEFDSSARQKKIVLNAEIDDEIWVSSTGDALQTIVVNLLSNAIKYTEIGGRVTVSLNVESDDAVFQVADSGVGIPAADLDSVFDLFERGAATGPGTGIGLTLVKELVDAHEGSIAVESKEGVGTTIAARIPATQATEEDSPHQVVMEDFDASQFVREDDEEEAATAVAAADGTPEVLIIDDNDDMRRFVIDLLSPDYRCNEASDGDAGLTVATESIPDVVICDVMMPGIDGFEVLHKLRESEHTSHIPIIMLTAMGDQDSRLKGLEERADDYIAKPFDRKELRLRVRNLIDLSQLRAQRVGQQLYARDILDETRRVQVDGLSEKDRQFLDRLDGVVESGFHDAEFRPSILANAMFMSQRQLQRKMHSVLDTAPALYIRDYRLKKAREALLHGDAVTDVAFKMGFSSTSYFGKCFKERFNVLPSEVRPQ